MVVWRLARLVFACVLLTGPIARADLYPPLEPLWEHSAANGFYAPPILVGDTLYVGSLDKNVYALDAATGAERWRYTTGEMVYSGVALSEDQRTGFVASSDKVLYALDLATGQPRWQRPLDGTPYATPVVERGAVLIGTGTSGTLYAFDAATGDERWTFPMLQRLGSGLAAADGTVYAPSYDGRVYAIDIASARLIWQFGADMLIDSAPLVADGVVYIKLPTDAVHALDAKTGKPLWNRAGTADAPQGRNPSGWSPLRKVGSHILFGSLLGRIHALDAATGEPVWQSELGAPRPAPPAAAGPIGYAGDKAGGLTAIDLASGETAWQWQPAGEVEPQLISGIMWPPLVVDDRLYASSLDGHLYAFRGAPDRAAWEQRQREAAERREALTTAVGPTRTPSDTEVRALESLGRRAPGFVIWESNRDGAWDLYRMDTDGSGFRRLTSFSEERNPLAFTGYLRPRVAPDGHTVLFTYGRKGGRAEAWVVDAAGGAPRKLADGAPLNWAADGSAFFLVRDNRVWRQPLAGGEAVRVSEAELPVTGREESLVGAVRPDGGLIAFRGPRNEVIDLKSGKSLRTMGGCEAQVTADGRFVYWVQAPGDFRVWNPADDAEQPFLGTPPSEPFDYTYFPTVSPDLQWVAYGASPGEHDHSTSDYEIYVQALRDWKPEGAPVRLSWHPRTDRWPTLWIRR